MGTTCRHGSHTGGSFIDIARFSARSLGSPAALAQSRGLEAHFPSSRTRSGKSGKEFAALRVARTPSRGPHHIAPREKRLVQEPTAAVGPSPPCNILHIARQRALRYYLFAFPKGLLYGPTSLRCFSSIRLKAGFCSRSATYALPEILSSLRSVDLKIHGAGRSGACRGCDSIGASADF